MHLIAKRVIKIMLEKGIKLRDTLFPLISHEGVPTPINIALVQNN